MKTRGKKIQGVRFVRLREVSRVYGLPLLFF